MHLTYLQLEPRRVLGYVTKKEVREMANDRGRMDEMDMDKDMDTDVDTSGEMGGEATRQPASKSGDMNDEDSGIADMPEGTGVGTDTGWMDEDM